MKAFAEIKHVNIRVHDEGVTHTYVFACSATLIHMGREAELTAAVGKMTPTIWKAVRDSLLDLGVEEAFWEDRTETQRRAIRVDVRTGRRLAA